jgi:DNA recombination protein RmuC
MEIVLLIIGLAAGAGAAWLVARFKFTAESQSGASLVLVEQEKNRALTLQLSETRLSLDAERAKVIQLTNNLAATETNNRNLLEKLQDQKQELELLNEKLTLQFKNLANEIFEDKSKKFTDQNKSNMFDLLKPLGEKIVEFEKKVEETHKHSISQNAALREQLENLQKLNVQMTREAENLTRALKGDSKTQGAWGEFILESILEKSGLEKDREYFIQESITTEEGRFRPDVIIRLPENRHVIIDSKVSLTAYNTFMNAATDDEKIVALKAHILSMRQHMRGLGDKSYQKNVSESSLDFIIMFIPIEPAYILAIQSDKTLYEDALGKRIVFVSPTLLIPSLQLIKSVWKQEQQNRNTAEIVRQATALYEKFSGFTQDLLDVGNHIKKTQLSYEGAMNKLTTGAGNLVRRVEEFKKFGISPQKNVDARLVDRSTDQADLFEKP